MRPTVRFCALKSRMNPQAQYGADVIMRANYALEHGAEVPQVDCIEGAVWMSFWEKLAAEVGIGTARMRSARLAVVGNTCMHHLFLGISPGSLVHAPYTPAISRGA